MGPADWWAGSDTPVPKINLDPKKRPKVDLLVFQDKLLSERPLNKKVTKSADSSNGHSNGFSSNGKASTVNKEADNVRIKNVCCQTAFGQLINRRDLNNRLQ